MGEINEDLAFNVLSNLRADSATGPDGLPARILKNMAKALAYPLAMVASMIVDQGHWPADWRMHWIVALHKRNSFFDPKNYRGVHLTPQISKVVERMIAGLLKPFIVKLDLFGINQFAYAEGRGARDAIAFMTLSWIQTFEDGRKVAVFRSDVQGAFDRVRTKGIIV